MDTQEMEGRVICLAPSLLLSHLNMAYTEQKVKFISKSISDSTGQLHLTSVLIPRSHLSRRALCLAYLLAHVCKKLCLDLLNSVILI